ncbi:multidrug transporter AcrB [Hahella sp. CCB-MM4]|uniref:efflux RND transporter permease subunit n=1 Tax=Hahella sp. (strain CCB-MM4) TaxID=1926491 RepID=UPI000B9B0515|nr:efflux RND transporter permease subunit [Hahella sp. CCB-MM4]OZG74692.1 multidrug transporter AcrB [Hahella sp. CCB-MM4]
MILSDISVKRPVFASVVGLLLIAIGYLCFERLPLREYPAIDPPVVSISTDYPGASANIVETRITEIIEERISGVEGINTISSRSSNGRSRITVEFNINRDIDAATNDIRDRVSRIVDNLPDEADPPDIAKEDSSDDTILWMSLSAESMTVPELTDYARRYLIDRFSVLDGVARVRVGGGKVYAMRIWLDRNAMTARGLTVSDIEQALRAENVELPAGSIESRDLQFRVRTERNFNTAEDFRNLVLGAGEDGYLIRLGDIARVELGATEDRGIYRGNGVTRVGIGISKQSNANVIDVARAVKAQAKRVNKGLPEGMVLTSSYDSSVFVEEAVNEVVKTLFIAIGLVVLVILVFLRSIRATMVPAVTVPISLIAAFIAIYAFGFTINMFTLLALVLAIGMVVDDAIVVLENIDRRMHEHGETRLVAAFRGSRQIAFAVVATTLVLVAVFVPIAFMQGDVGRLFSEFALTLAAAVSFSSVVALTVSPALASKILPPLHSIHRNSESEGKETHFFEGVQNLYGKTLKWCLKVRWLWLLLLAGFCVGTWWLYRELPQEYAPKEDRGAFFIIVNGPEGATYEYMLDYMNEVERRLLPLVDSGEAQQVLVRAPRGWGNIEDFNSGFAIVTLTPWDQRRSAWDIMAEVRKKLSDLPGVRAFPVMRQGFGGGVQKPVQFVIGGGTYRELAEWRDILQSKIDEDNPGLDGVDFDYKETRPFLSVQIDYNRAADLGVKVQDIGRTLETMLGGRTVTTYLDNGQEYSVIVEGEPDLQRTPSSIENIYVRSSRSGELIPLSNVVTLQEYADSASLNRFNRLRALTIEANLDDNLNLGDALGYLEGLVRDNLPDYAQIDYKGQSADFREAGTAVYTTLLLGILIVFLVLAAQFESYIHPFVIMLTVPLAVAGGMLGLYVTGNSLNLYTQIGLIMLVGLAAKNGILIVEFSNQLRDQGLTFDNALVEASVARLRPILMTAVTTIAGAVPLMISAGPGSETRSVIGTVILWGVSAATLFTIFVVPVAYSLLAKKTSSPKAVETQLNKELQLHEDVALEHRTPS